jgi:hypothetical protein
LNIPADCLKNVGKYAQLSEKRLKIFRLNSH